MQIGVNSEKVSIAGQAFQVDSTAVPMLWFAEAGSIQSTETVENTFQVVLARSIQANWLQRGGQMVSTTRKLVQRHFKQCREGYGTGAVYLIMMLQRLRYLPVEFLKILGTGLLVERRE